MTTQTFLGRDRSPVSIPRTAVDRDLREPLGPRALAPDDAGYDDARRLWNAMIDRRPGLVVRPRDAADVQRCVRFAREHGVVVTVRGAGHNIGGRAVADGALLLDLSGHRDVRVDATTGIASVQPGATLGDVDAATAPHGLVVPTGIVSETGIAGLTLGGGFGWLSRRWGLTCDHLVGVEIVTGDGEIVSASETSHPDLLWALRGGGGGCGIVTELRFRARELDPTVTAGPLFTAGEHAEDAMGRFRARTADSPETMGCAMKLGAAPPAPFLPEAMHGRPCAITLACHTGDPAAAERDLAPLRRTPGPAADLVQRRPFAQFQAMFDAGEPRGRRDYWKSEYVLDVDDRLTGVLLGAIEHLPSPHANIKVFHLGGAVSRVPADATAVGHRDASYIVVVASAWEDSAHDEPNLAWVRDTWSRVHALSGRGGYINFLTEEVGADERDRTRGGVDLDRLAEIVRRHDPDALFAGGGWRS